MAVILKTQSVTKKFGGFTAVEKVSLSVSQGEVRFIIGPNGAGKSTFFKLIIGYHNPDEGSIIYKDKNIEKLKLHERINLGMGVKFQAPSIFSELTVLQNLSLANNEDFFKICHTLYCNKYNIYGKSFWHKKFLESLNLNLYDSEKKVSSKINELIQSKNLNNIVNKITHSIEDLN